MDSQKPIRGSRQINYQQSTKNSHSHSPKRNDQDKKKNSKWWIEPDKWKKMSTEDRMKHLKKAREARQAQAAKKEVPTYEKTNLRAEALKPSDNKPTLAQQLTSNAASLQKAVSLNVNGVTYTASKANIQYTVKQHEVMSSQGSLIDSGANGGLSGSDVHVISISDQVVDVIGISNNAMKDLNLCTVAGYIQTTSGPVIGLFHQYADTGSGNTIHSVNQLEAFGVARSLQCRSSPG